MNYYMHIIPGRISIRTSSLQKNEAELFSISKTLKTIRGVTSFKANAGNGSVLIHYDRSIISFQRILHLLTLQGSSPGIQWNTPKIISSRSRPLNGTAQ